MNRRRRDSELLINRGGPVFCLVAMSLLVVSLQPAFSADRVEVLTISGKRVEGEWFDRSDDRLELRKQVTGGDRTEISWMDLVELRTFHEIATVVPSPRVSLVTGDLLRARPLRIENDRLICQWTDFPDWQLLELPLTTVQGILWDSKTPSLREARWLQALREPLPGKDRIFLANGDVSTGLLLGFDGTFFEFETASGSLKINASGVAGLIFDPDLLDRPPALSQWWILSLHPGNRLIVTEWNGQKGSDWQVTLANRRQLAIPRRSVEHLQAVNSRVVPATILETWEMIPFLSRVRQPRLNYSVNGGALRVAGREEALGWGVHAKTRMQLKVPPGATHFATRVGLDESGQAMGAVTLQILLNDQTVWQGELNRAIPEQPVKAVAVTPGQILTLHADYGVGADVGDEVDWLFPVWIMASQATRAGE